MCRYGPFFARFSCFSQKVSCNLFHGKAVLWAKNKGDMHMKRISILLLALLLTAGCLSKNPSQSEGTDRPAPQDTPPELTVSSGENHTRAILSTYSWSWPNPDGTSTGVEADGLHPLDMIDLLTPLPLIEGCPLTLRFELGALTLDRLTIRRWDLSSAGDPTRYESGFTLLSFTQSGNAVTVELPEKSSGIFEVHAYFTGESQGDGYYAFCLQGPETSAEGEQIPFESQTVRIVWRENLGEQPQTQVIRTPADLAKALGEDEAYESSADLLDELKASYTEPFFSAQELLLLRLEEGSGSISLQVTSVFRAPNGVTVTVRRQVPEICTADMAAWLLFVSLPQGTVSASDAVTVVVQ